VAAVLIRNLSEEAHRALKARAVEHGRSTEAEIRAILEEVALPLERVKVGSALAALGRRYGGVELDIERDRSPVETAEFE
jgi:plasmid stability protein